MRQQNTMTKWDKSIFCVLIAGAVLALFLQGFLFSGSQNLQAVVEIDGREYGRYSLQEKNGKSLAIRTEFGYNKIVIENGSVKVTESDCPDHLEIAVGSIQKSGEMLICLPNRLVIRIVGEGSVDGVAY